MHVTTVLILLLQLSVILALSRLMGNLAMRLHQPRVVGEMLAGIMLGPSLLGLVSPDAYEFLFPQGSVRLLNVLAQVGVILFLFLIGLELDPKLIRDRGHAAVVISHASIVVPFVLGAALTLVLYPLVFNDAPQMRFTAVALFMGAAMSITAFPVLARILTERDLQKTKVGALAITCAAVDDVTAWCMLAFVVAIGRAEGLLPGLVTAGLSGVYVLVMFFAVRPLLKRIQAVRGADRQRASGTLAVVLLLTLASAAATEYIGIHALFGAFLMGAIMPKDPSFVRPITERVEDLTVTFLLPVFFAYAGLRTQIGLLDTPLLWVLTALIILVACLGKFGGSAVAAWVCGFNWRESAAVGVLMNTRGLMELVILTIGLQIGVITDAVFAMMVLMALATTAMTTPVLHWVYPRRMFHTAAVDDATAEAEFGVVVPVARAESGPGLAKAVALLDGPKEKRVKLYGLHLVEPEAREYLGLPIAARQTADDVFGPMLREAALLDLPAESVTFRTRDLASDIARVARAKRADLILMGAHQSLLGQAALGGIVHRVLTGADTDVAILVDRALPDTPRILVPFQGSPHDRLALDLARRIGAKAGAGVTVMRVGNAARKASSDADAESDGVTQWIVEDSSPVDAVLRHAGRFDLAVIGVGEEWGLMSHLFGFRAERVAREWPGSLLVVRKHQPVAELHPPTRAGPDHAEQPVAVHA